MCKKWGAWAGIILLLGAAGSVSAVSFQEPVDLTLAGPNGTPWPPTWKPGWTPWPMFGDTGEPHDARNIFDVNGSGINMGIAGSGPPFWIHFGVSIDPFYVDPICNTWVLGNPDAHLVLWGEGLFAGQYRVLTYHNRTDLGEPNDPVMPRVFVETYCAANIMARFGREWIPDIAAPYNHDCNNVIPTANDVNVAVQQETSDAHLVPSVVEFIIAKDGTPVHIVYEAPQTGEAVINAFVIQKVGCICCYIPPWPLDGAGDVCTDVELGWIAGTYAAQYDVYFGTDYNDVNDANTSVPKGVYIGRQPANDTDYDPCGLLEFSRTYYWRVDRVNDACSPYLYRGFTWSFTTESGKARYPSPPDGAWSVEGTYVEWEPSCRQAGSHDIYFSDNFDDVNDGTAFLMTWPEPWFDFGGLTVPGGRYYWRIDEKGSVDLPAGDVWSFQGRGGALMDYSFDGTPDANLPDPITDDIGNVTFVHCLGSVPNGVSPQARLTYGQPNPLVNPLGTSVHFEPTGQGEGNALRRQVYGQDILDLEQDGYTIEMWIKQDAPTTENISSQAGGEDFAASLFRKWDRSYAVAIGVDQAVRFAHSGLDNFIETHAGIVEPGEWHHLGAVFDGRDPCRPQKIYMNGILSAAGGAASPNPCDDDDVAIGAAVRPRRCDYQRLSNPFHGCIDELRVYDIALGPGGPPPPPGPWPYAWLPSPSHGQNNVSLDTRLVWRPGEFASSHDVYMGTSESAVTDANTSETLSVFIENREPNEYDPGGLELDTTYYWRIDEVNDSNGYKWKGMVWRFATANYVTIDDFEQYDQDDRIYYIWDDGQINGSGSYIDLGIAPRDPVYDPEQSMLCVYDNQVDWGYGAYVSEVSRLVDFTDWTSVGLKVLTLQFYGDPHNDANETEGPYVGVEDTRGPSSYAEVRYSTEGHDNNDLRVAEWHEWNMPLSEFSDQGVDLNNVDVIYVGFGDRTNDSTAGGFGLVYIDQICLQPPICVPDKAKPRADLNDDCVVDYKDLKIMADEWLCSSGCAADLYLDGKTDLKDCAIMVNLWLEQKLWPE
ncbi:MAG: LamG domain-containing protein [Planctomycetota bacterium]